uniref:Uncharacterized protein n=1 Tax=Arundo donax TaxID=35708 RepID=A0A0A8Z9C1_ARUDO
MDELQRIGYAFNRFTAHMLSDRNELLSLLCTPAVRSILGGVRANCYTNTHQVFSCVHLWQLIYMMINITSDPKVLWEADQFFVRRGIPLAHKQHGHTSICRHTMQSA